MASWIFSHPFLSMALMCATGSALLVLWYLVRRPALSHATKLVLLLGIGVLPIATATTGNVAGFEATKQRSFCGSCHVMTPYRTDSEDPNSTTLAARHARNPMFGDENCYACHANYGMFGTIVTKMGGLRHVYEYTLHYRNMSLEEARAKIHIREPFQNSTCMQCHSTDRSDLEPGQGAREPARSGTRWLGELRERGLPRSGAPVLQVEWTDPMTDETTAAEPEQPADAGGLSRRATLALRLAAVLTLIGLALMVWSMLQPTPLPVMLAMTVGQVVGTTAFGLYLFVVVRQLRREYGKK